MRRALSLVCCASLALTAWSDSARAQAGPLAVKRDSTEWANLSALSPGTMIEVVDRNSPKKHRGTFVGFGDASISLRDHSGEQDLRRQDVLSVKVRGGRLPHAGIWVIGGAAVGAAAGLLAANAASKTDSGASYDAGILGGAAIGAILGLLADAGISRVKPSYRVIYRSK